MMSARFHAAHRRHPLKHSMLRASACARYPRRCIAFTLRIMAVARASKCSPSMRGRTSQSCLGSAACCYPTASPPTASRHSPMERFSRACSRIPARRSPISCSARRPAASTSGSRAAGYFNLLKGTELPGNNGIETSPRRQGVLCGRLRLAVRRRVLTCRPIQAPCVARPRRVSCPTTFIGMKGDCYCGHAGRRAGLRRPVARSSMARRMACCAIVATASPSSIPRPCSSN